ncbi:MAG: GIY-YIG nuclease family protein [Candidatus Rokubacteria bacterium]|nr:GIY-YIG nuclease family protein [Candidatus Rokubacteria bacterium]
MAWTALKLKCSSCRHLDLIFIERLEGNPRCSNCAAVFEGIEVHSGVGFIYLLSNPYMPGLVKIGFTERDVFERAKELCAATGVPAPYVVEAYFPTRNASDEAAVHQALVDNRVPDREFFRVGLEDALTKVSQICGFRALFLREGLRPTRPNETWLRCRKCGNEWSMLERAQPDLRCPKCAWSRLERIRTPNWAVGPREEPKQ